MNREQLLAYILETYDITPDYPWARSPNFAILRHPGSRKWFAAIMDLTADKLGLPGSHILDAVNLKCGPLLVGAERSRPGILAAYHMNKENWVTVLLDGTAAKEDILRLLDLSYELTL